MLQNASGGIVFISDLAQLGKLQQMNLVFALERLERHNLQLVAASTRPMAGLVEAGWDPLLVSRLGEVWVALPQISGTRRRRSGNRFHVARPSRRAR
jgi:two-component system nitrogen regulation response regulator NtrX